MHAQCDIAAKTPRTTITKITQKMTDDGWCHGLTNGDASLLRHDGPN